LKNLLQRTVSGILYLVIIIGSLFLGKYAFGTLFLIIVMLALVEFYNLMGFQSFMPVTAIGLLTGAGLFILAFLVAAQMIDTPYLALAATFPVISLVTALYSKRTDIMHDLPKILLGILYIAGPLAMMNYLVFPASVSHIYTHRIVLGILILVWVNDTGAYVTGTTIGRHRLFPRISPKKSWEGVIGGSLVTLVPAFWMDRIMGILSVADWMILAVIVCVLGVYGDLAESLIKRNADRKDSGALIPGHGGVLDRFDSVLFVMPAAFIYLVIRGI
jgi:phosphatidate cytidylyltransferase